MNADQTATGHRPTIAAHLMGHLDVETGDAISAGLRLPNFLEFRALGESILSLRNLGFDVRISVSDPRMRAVLADLELGEALVNGIVAVDCHVLLGDPKFAARRAS
jgi:hypothetical protein